MEELDLQRWRSAMLHLRENSFYDLIRNYLGKIKTPFNKHTLLKRLEVFLQKPENYSTIIGLIDEDELNILNRIKEGISHDSLYKEVKDQYDFIDLHQLLLNLEDRMLIYTDKSVNPSLFRLTPQLQIHIERSLASVGSRLHFSVQDESAGRPPVLDERLLLAVFCFITEKKLPYNKNGQIRKNLIQRVNELFPGVEQLIEGIITALLKLAVINEEGLIHHNFKKFISLSAEERLSHILPLMCGISSSKKKRRFMQLLQQIDTTMAFTNTEFIQLAAANSIRLDDSIPDLLYYCGVLNTTTQDGELRYQLNPFFFYKQEEDGGMCIIQPNFTFLVRSHFTLNEGWPLSLCCKLKSFGAYPELELTKAGFIKCSAYGIDGSELEIQLLQLSRQPLPANISTSIESWDQEQKEITVLDGVAIKCDSARARIIGHSPQMEEHILGTLSETIILLKRETRKKWELILEELGILLPRSTRAIALENDISYEMAKQQDSLLIPSPEDAVHNSEETDVTTLNKERESALLKELETLKVSPDIRKELELRIKRKLIFSSQQLGQDISRGEKNEARGLDFQAKLRLIKSVISEGRGLLEILTPGEDGNRQRILLKPISLEKTKRDTIIRGVTIPDKIPIHLAAGKLLLVRRLRGSLISN